MEKFTFEMLPELISQINNRLENIEKLCSNKKTDEFVEDFINSKQASLLLNFTLPTLYSKVCKGEVPFYKKGNRLYFSRSELIEWIENGKKETLLDLESTAYKIAKKLSQKSRF